MTKKPEVKAEIPAGRDLASDYDGPNNGSIVSEDTTSAVA